MAAKTEVVSLEVKSYCQYNMKQQLDCGIVTSYGDRGDCSDESCVFVADVNGVGGESVGIGLEEVVVEDQTGGTGVVNVDVDVSSMDVEVGSSMVYGAVSEVGGVDVWNNLEEGAVEVETRSVNVDVSIKELEVGSLLVRGSVVQVDDADGSSKEVESVNVEVDSPVATGMDLKVENVEVSGKEVHDVNVGVDFPVVNGTVEVKDVDVSVKEVVSVNLEVDSLDTENVLLSIEEVENVIHVEVDSPVVNGILTEVDVGSTKDGDGLQVVEPCAHAVEQNEPTELRAKCKIQPVELCDGKLSMVVVPELEMAGGKETDFEGVANSEKESGIESGVDPTDTSEYVGSTTENESCKGIDEAHELVLSTTGNVSAKDIIEAQNGATAPTSNVTVTYKEVTSCLSSNKEDASNITWEKSNIMFGTLNVEVMGDQPNGPVGSSGQNLILEDNETNHTIAIDSSCSVNVGMASEGQKVEAKPFNYLVKFPRADDESLKKQINVRKVLVDKYTKRRDDIRVQIQETRKV